MVYKCRGLQTRYSCTTGAAQTQPRSSTTNTLIAFIPTATQQGDKPFKRMPLSQLLAVLRKQGKLVSPRTEVSSEGVYISIFLSIWITSAFLKIISQLSQLCCRSSCWVVRGPTNRTSRQNQVVTHTSVAPLISIQLMRNEACRARLQPAQSRTFWTARGPWHHAFFSTDPLLLAHFR